MKATIKHIAVIRLSALGDVAMTVPVLQALSEQYPELQITMVSKPFVKPLFAHLPKVNFVEAHVYQKHKGILGLRKLAKSISQLKVDAVVDLHNVIRTKILRNFIQMQGMPVVVIDKGRAQKKALTRSENKVFKQLASTHERYAATFSSLGLSTNLPSNTFTPKQPLTGKASDLMGLWKGKAIAVAPFAAFETKMYPLDLMREVLKELSKDQTYKLFLFGGGESEKAALVELSMGIENAEVVVGKLDFADELALISNMDLMISMDSANGHLAANYGVPVITLWGATHPYLGFTPFGQPMSNQLLPDLDKYPEIPTSVYGKTLPESHKEVMRSILPESVVKKAQELLQ